MTTAAGDLLRLLRFYARLSLPALPFERDPHALPDFARAAWLLPFAGALIGAVGAAVLVAASALGLGPVLAALLGLAALVIVTGAFHEDGLADCADGFWGGSTPGRRLEIMKDSRIGSYGGAALMLSLLLRAAALAALAERGGVVLSCVALIAAAAFSRVCGLMPLALLAPARNDGAGAAAARPALAGALAVAGGLGGVLALAGGLPLLALPAMASAVLMAGLVTRLAHAKIGGQTGDVAGAAQQLAEIGFLLALVAGT